MPRAVCAKTGADAYVSAHLRNHPSRGAGFHHRKGAKFTGSTVPTKPRSSQALICASTAHLEPHPNRPLTINYVFVFMEVPSLSKQPRMTRMDANRPLRIDSDRWRPALHGRGSVKPDVHGQVVALRRREGVFLCGSIIWPAVLQIPCPFLDNAGNERPHDP